MLWAGTAVSLFGLLLRRHLEAIVNLSDFVAISLIPVAVMLPILCPGSSRFRIINEGILVIWTTPVGGFAVSVTPVANGPRHGPQ